MLYSTTTKVQCHPHIAVLISISLCPASSFISVLLPLSWNQSYNPSSRICHCSMLIFVLSLYFMDEWVICICPPSNLFHLTLPSCSIHTAVNGMIHFSLLLHNFLPCIYTSIIHLLWAFRLFPYRRLITRIQVCKYFQINSFCALGIDAKMQNQWLIWENYSSYF